MLTAEQIQNPQATGDSQLRLAEKYVRQINTGWVQSGEYQELKKHLLTLDELHQKQLLTREQVERLLAVQDYLSDHKKSLLGGVHVSSEAYVGMDPAAQARRAAAVARNGEEEVTHA